MSYHETHTDMFELQGEWHDKQQELHTAIEQRREATKRLAEAERKYRTQLSVRMLMLHTNGYQGKINGVEYDTDTVAWTAVENLAKGLPDVASLREGRDIAKSETEAAKNFIFKLQNDLDHIQHEIKSVSYGS